MRKNKQSMYKIFWNTTPRNYFDSLSQLMNNIVDVLKAIDKDFSDTFKPYKAFYAVKRDILQPLFGLKNIFLGLLAIPTIPLMLLWDTVKIIPWLIKEDEENFPDWRFPKLSVGLCLLVANIGKSFLQTACSIALILQGVTQILTTPLTWLFKIPLRFLITPAGGPKIEDNAGFKRAQLQYYDRDYELQVVQSYELHRKYRKQAERGQATNIDHLNEGSTFAELERRTSFLEFSYKDGEFNGVHHRSTAFITAQETANAKQATLAYLSLFRQKQSLSPAGTTKGVFPHP